jgi:hypothetical protein
MKKAYILDCLMDGDETKTQILEFFKFINQPVSESELDVLLEVMMRDGLITVNYKWQNEKGEFPFCKTEKGKELWEQAAFE